MDFSKIQNIIKSEFCELTTFKMRERELEIITPYLTLNNKFISVFIRFQNDTVIVTDGGWISKNYYDTPFYEASQEIHDKIVEQYRENYKVLLTLDNQNNIYYYRKCTNFINITQCVFEFSAFMTGVINSKCYNVLEVKDSEERAKFRKAANLFFSNNYNDNFQTNASLPDMPRIRFNGLINQRNAINLVTYVTGSNITLFENDLRKSIVNFELIERSNYYSVTKHRLTILNDEAEGFKKGNNPLTDFLADKLTHPPIRWEEREKILELIQL